MAKKRGPTTRINNKPKTRTKTKTKKKIGLALGGGSARGLAHIGVLKVLHQNKIYPDYIAGTSIGSVIGALYASGHTPEEIEDLTQTTDWKNIVDFTVPKSGIIKGYRIEKRIKKLTHSKDFEDLEIPLRVVAVDLNKKEKAVFSKGDVSKAVHASLAIPGIFTPVKIGKDLYVDGGLIDPTPFDVAEEMGADFIIAVDLSYRLKTIKAPRVKATTFYDELKKKFIAEELIHLKHYLSPKRFPQFVINLFHKLFDRLLYPQKIIKILAKREQLPIIKVIYQSNQILFDSLSKEKLKDPAIDILINPLFKDISWTDFDKIKQLIKLGEQATKRKLPEIKKKLGIK